MAAENKRSRECEPTTDAMLRLVGAVGRGPVEPSLQRRCIIRDENGLVIRSLWESGKKK